MAKDQWYFAYGSNLDIQRKELRTGPIREALLASLADYRFAFNKLGTDGTGKANLVPEGGERVWGVVYRCSPEAMLELDRHEGAPDHYARTPVTVLLDSGETASAIAYIAGADRCRDGLRPTPEYLAHVLSGASHHGLPFEYIRSIEALA